MKNRILTVLVTVVTFVCSAAGDDSGSKGVIAYTPKPCPIPF